MRIFLSYPNAHQRDAETIAATLKSAGNDVLFAKDNIIAGDDFNKWIRESLYKSDMMIFLVTPESVQRGSFPNRTPFCRRAMAQASRAHYSGDVTTCAV